MPPTTLGTVSTIATTSDSDIASSMILTAATTSATSSDGGDTIAYFTTYTIAAATSSTTSATSGDDDVGSALTVAGSALTMGDIQPVPSYTLYTRSTVSSTPNSAASDDLQASTSATRRSSEMSVAASFSAAEASRSASRSQEASASSSSSSSSNAPPTKTALDNDISTSTVPTFTSQDIKDGGGLSTGVQAGIGAACGLLGLAAILVLGFLLTKRRKTLRTWKPELQHGDFSEDPNARTGPMVQDYVPFAELEAREVKQEMPASYVYPVELEGADIGGIR